MGRWMVGRSIQNEFMTGWGSRQVMDYGELPLHLFGGVQGGALCPPTEGRVLERCRRLRNESAPSTRHRKN